MLVLIIELAQPRTAGVIELMRTPKRGPSSFLTAALVWSAAILFPVGVIGKKPGNNSARTQLAQANNLSK